MSKIHLCRGLNLDAEIAAEVSGFIGMRGSGKSNSLAVVAEQLLAHGIQVVILDYVGIHFSIRLDESGKHASPFKIPVLGGRHGDIGLQPTAGRLVAESLVASNSSAVLDLSGFSKADRCRFAADFAERIFECKRNNPGPCWLALEEAQRFVPQKILTGMEYLARMLGAFEEIAEVGRNFGLGLGLNTQRPQKIAKDVLNLADNVFAFRLNGVLERKAVAEWVQEKGAEGRSEVGGELPGLPRGTALVWSPNRGIYGKYALDRKTTYDAGATPMHARAAVKVKSLDLGELEASMVTIVEQSKANDPKALKARIAELERALKKQPAPVVEKVDRRRVKTVEVPTVPKAAISQIQKLLDVSYVSDPRTDLKNAIATFEKLFGGLKKVEHALSKSKIVDEPPQYHAVKSSDGTLRVPDTKPKWETVKVPLADNGREQVLGWSETQNGALNRGERAVLTAIAQHSDGVTREQITVIAGYKRSTRDLYLQRLARANLTEEHGGRIFVTSAGRDALGEAFEPLPTGDALRAHHLTRLPEGERTILEAVIAAYPEPIDRDTVGESANYKRSTRDLYLQRLTRRRLITSERGLVRASDMLFG